MYERLKTNTETEIRVTVVRNTQEVLSNSKINSIGLCLNLTTGKKTNNWDCDSMTAKVTVIFATSRTDRVSRATHSNFTKGKISKSQGVQYTYFN